MSHSQRKLQRKNWLFVKLFIVPQREKSKSGTLIGKVDQNIVDEYNKTRIPPSYLAQN